MRRMLLLGTLALILSVSTAGALAMPTGASGARDAYDEQSAEIRSLTWSDDTKIGAPPVLREAAMKSAERDVESLPKEIVATLRTALLLGFAGVVVGFGAVGVKSLWVRRDRAWREHPVEAGLAPARPGSGGAPRLRARRNARPVGGTSRRMPRPVAPASARATWSPHRTGRT